MSPPTQETQVAFALPNCSGCARLSEVETRQRLVERQVERVEGLALGIQVEERAHWKSVEDKLDRIHALLLSRGEI